MIALASTTLAASEITRQITPPRSNLFVDTPLLQVIFTENMASDPLGTLEEVFDFLGLDLIDSDGIQVTALFFGNPLLDGDTSNTCGYTYVFFYAVVGKPENAHVQSGSSSATRLLHQITTR